MVAGDPRHRPAIDGRVVERIGSMPLQQLTPAALNAFYGELGSSESERTGKLLSPRTVRYVHAVLRRALADAMKWNRLACNPADVATAPSAKAAKAPKPATWSASEVRTFLDSVRGDRFYPLWLLYATTGLRRGEALGLRWRDLELDGGDDAPRAPSGFHVGIRTTGRRRARMRSSAHCRMPAPTNPMGCRSSRSGR